MQGQEPGSFVSLMEGMVVLAGSRPTPPRSPSMPDGDAGGEEAVFKEAADVDSEMVNVWLISASSKYLLPEAERGVFWSANCYMILYTWEQSGKEKCSLYFWKGEDMSNIDFLTWRFQLLQLLKDMPGAPVP